MYWSLSDVVRMRKRDLNQFAPVLSTSMNYKAHTEDQIPFGALNCCRQKSQQVQKIKQKQQCQVVDQFKRTARWHW